MHRIAVLASVDVVSVVTADDLAKPTPCAGWNLADLLAHMTVQHRGFAAAARGHGADEAIWQPATVADAVAADPAGTYSTAAAEVIDAFAGDGVLDSEFALPELGPGAAFPGAMAIGFHHVDYVVHGWDVARATGQPYETEPEMLDSALAFLGMFASPDAPAGPEVAFGPSREVPGDAPALDRVLALAGRDPAWLAG